MRDATEIQEALRRSRVWLAATGSRPEASARHALQALLGAWACTRALADEDAPELRSLAGVALAKLSRGESDLRVHDAKLLLVCLHALERLGLEAPGLRAFADSLAAELASLPRIPARQAGVAGVLHQLGRPISPAVVEQPPEPSLDGLLRGGPESVRAACSAVAAASHFGARRIAPPAFEALRRTLPVLFVQSLRAYDLDTAAMLLRASRYLRLRRSGRIGEGVAFLLDQQKPDGRFGYFAVEASGIARSGDVPGFDETLTLSLPVTSTCAWALAEHVGDGGLLFVRSRGPVRRRPARVLSVSPTT